jgi:light-regulated signal transduction histidine kinase (bacteriophytochrome)
VGRNVFALIHPDDVRDVLRTNKEALAKPRCPVAVQARIRRSDGQWCWVESTSANLLDEPDIKAVVLNYRDISERKAAEIKKQEYAEQLARSNAELEAFAYAAAHDLQEPLRTVSAFTQLLVHKEQLTPHGNEMAGFIIDGVRRMSSLLDDLLSFSGLNCSGPLDQVSLQQVVQKVLDNLRQTVTESGAAITMESLPVVRGNETHLVQLFQNLLTNAIKYRSELSIEIHISSEEHGEEWIVKVRDNGMGIAPEYHDYVFGLFKRLHTRAIAGTGIGLAISKKIVEGMRGRIWVESEPGKGSTFCFTAPSVNESR